MTDTDGGSAGPPDERTAAAPPVTHWPTVPLTALTVASIGAGGLMTPGPPARSVRRAGVGRPAR